MQPNNSEINNNSSSSASNNDVVFRDRPKKKTGMIIGMICLALLAIGGIGFGVWAYLSGNQKEAKLNEQIAELQAQNNELTSDASEMEEVENSSDEGNSDESGLCEGTYYGEANGTLPNGLSYDYKYTYTLNSDGTFSADNGGASGTSGVFLINGNTISLIGSVETSGPADSAKQYSTKDYLIEDDCSSITIDDGDVSVTLNRQ